MVELRRRLLLAGLPFLAAAAPPPRVPDFSFPAIEAG